MKKEKKKEERKKAKRREGLTAGREGGVGVVCNNMQMKQVRELHLVAWPRPISSDLFVVFITRKKKKKKKKKKSRRKKSKEKERGRGGCGSVTGVGDGDGGECVAAYFMLPLVRKPLSVLLSTVYNCDRHVLA